MIIAKVKIKGVSAYSMSRKHGAEKKEKEGADAYEKRTWREKCHFDDKGDCFIPPMAFKQAIDAAAKYLSISIPGKGKATYTKHFLSGVLVMDPLPLGVKKDEVQGEWIYANADGVRGSGKRVDRCFPCVPAWSGTLIVNVFDRTITKEVFEEVIDAAGKFVGIGRFRPEKGGFKGRFEVQSVDWNENVK